MQLNDAIEDYRYAIAHLSPKTQSWYLTMLGAFSRWCDGEGVQTLESVSATTVRKYLAEVRSPNEREKARSSYTIHAYAETIKVFLNWCEREELLVKNPAARIEMPKVDRQVIRTFTASDISRLLAACKYSTVPFRDRALVMTMLDTGVRASELCDLRLRDTHLSPAGGHLVVVGKGRKEREVGISAKACLAVAKYVRTRKSQEPQQRTFLSRSGKPMTAQGLLNLCQRLNLHAGIEGIRVSPHTFRHTFALTFLREGGDIYRLSKLLGHSSVTVTEHYLRDFRAEDARSTGISVLEALSR